ncbi:MAG: beta family protein, partial [Clostridiales bacterium]|nr:beta family protein [Clostridiales bacterium]
DYNLMPSNISVLIDLKEDVDISCFEKAISALKEIRILRDYMNVIIASGAFPEDMSKINTDDDCRPRTDWLNWYNKSNDHGLLRYPAFADYTIRYPIYNEQAEQYRATATIKYTLKSEWRFFKGEVSKYEMCLANASVFRKDKEFFGRDYSAGDKYIDDKGAYYPEYMREISKNPGGTGNATTWIRAGINHHIAVVVDQIANLDA